MGLRCACLPRTSAHVVADREVIGRGIRVNAIAPGYIDTPLLDEMPAMMRFLQLASRYER